MIGLCERFGALPSQVLAEDSQVLRLLEIIRLGTSQGGGEQR